jgi:hypothetical protein
MEDFRELGSREGKKSSCGGRKRREKERGDKKND